ncbi:MAG: AI-2E family transporter [Phycisphaeraceae bacterium]|nr:AI-2E family transporter [Phycisphaeraceae bacterium]
MEHQGQKYPSDEKSATTSPPIDWKTMRLWQIQPVRDVLLVLVIVGLVYLGYMASLVTVPILLAILLAYLFEPLVAWLVRKKVTSRRGGALLIILFAVLVIVVPTVLGGTFAVVQGVRFAETTTRNVDLLIRSVEKPDDEQLRAGINNEGWGRVRDFLVKENQKRVEARDAAGDTEAAGLVQSVLIWLRDNSREIGKQAALTSVGAFAVAASVLRSFVFLVFGAALTAFFFFFFCTGWGQVLAFWESLIPEQRKWRVIDLVHQMDQVIAGFVRGRIIICALVGVWATLAYWLIGAPAPLVFGPMVGALFIVPYVHSLMIPIVIIAMAIDPSGVHWQATWWWIVLGPILVYMSCQVIDDYVLTPTIQGNATGMDTPTIVFASFAGGALMGVYGLLIAIPVAACIKILLREVFWPRFKAWAEGRARDFLPIADKR